MADPFNKLYENMADVRQLLKIHEQKTGTRPGRRYNVSALHKSAVVLITACWEAFIEDTVAQATSSVVDNVAEPARLPKSLRKAVAKRLESKGKNTSNNQGTDDQNELRVWRLAGDGWKDVVRETVKQKVSDLNTPTPDNIRTLFEGTLDLKDLPSKWRWRSMSNTRAQKTLQDYVNLRHDIAHRVKAKKRVTKDLVKAYANLVRRLAAITSNTTRDCVQAITGQYPWIEATADERADIR